MASTATVAVRRHAIEELSGLLDTEQVLVTYAWQPDARERNQLFTMRSRGETPPAALRMGRNHRNETGQFTLVIHVFAVGASQEEADEQAIEFGQVVEEYFADNRSPDVEGLNWWAVESYEMDGGQADRASVSQLLYTIKFDARLT